MNFTQFMFPNGRRVPQTISMDPQTEEMATVLENANWRFEIEINPDTQLVHMDCCDDDEAIAVRLVLNGPKVPAKVKELVGSAYEEFCRRGRPIAHGKPRPMEFL